MRNFFSPALFLFLSLLVIAASACYDADLPPVKYLQWVEKPEHGLLQNAETPAFRYVLLYKPKPYVVLKNNPGIQTGHAAYLRAENNLDDLNYASLWLESADGTDLLKQGRPGPEEQERRARYCAFDIQHDLSLVEGADTLACVFAHWERLGSLGSRQHFILAFEKSRDPSPCDNVFIFKNRLLAEETVRFHISKSALDQLPVLEF